jgi:PAS domain S-box-containing protein
MHHSIFFRRLLAMLLLALLLWTVLTAVFYNFISRPIFTKIKISELEPKAQSLSELAGTSFLQGDPYFDNLVQSSYELFDAWTYVIDGISMEIYSSALPPEENLSDEEIRTRILNSADELLSGRSESIWFTRSLSSSRQEMLFIGVPITFRFGQQTGIVGAIYFVKPMSELNAGLRSLNIALITASASVLLLMLIPLYFAAGKLIKPLRQTRDVALAMVSGDFSVRANISQEGEIGELAMTMNHLADELAVTISALTTERNRLRQIIDGMAEGIMAVDSSGVITQTNTSALGLFGLDKRHDNASAEEILEFTQLREALDKVINQGQVQEINLQANHRVILCRLSPIEESTGLKNGAVILFRDITESERLEQTRKDYVANISHELRTPLTAMRALIEPLRDKMVRTDQDRDRYYRILLQETMRLSRLIDDMLDLSRLQAGSNDLQMQVFLPQQLIKDLLFKYEYHAEDLGIGIGLDAAANNCPAALGHPERIEQVLVILIDNALKFTPEQGNIQLGLTWDESLVTFYVKDSGSGIEPEDIDHVFERFYKADKAHSHTGTGLGLAIAREIIHRHGQRIWVKSQPGQGTTFYFNLSRADGISETSETD